MVKKWTGYNFNPQKIRNPKIWFETYLLCRHLTKTLKMLAPACKGKLLDVGAGQSPYKPFFMPYVKEYITLDFYVSPDAKVDYISSVYHLPFKDNSFDVVLCTQVLEHVDSPQKAIDEMRRILKPSGKLILSTHMAMVLHSEPYDYFRFTKYGLKDVLFKKFRNAEIITNGGAVCFMCQVLSWSFFYRVFFPLNKLFIILFNCAGVFLDRIFYSDYLTLNYFVVAKK